MALKIQANTHIKYPKNSKLGSKQKLMCLRKMFSQLNSKLDGEKKLQTIFEDNLSTYSNNTITNILVKELSLTILKIFNQQKTKKKNHLKNSLFTYCLKTHWHSSYFIYICVKCLNLETIIILHIL